MGYIKSYNNSVLGSVVYNIYLKDAGGLTKVTSVSSGSATVKLPSTASPTYVVKTGYSNFGGAESSGVEVKVNSGGASASDYEIKLKGDATVNLSVGDSYSDKGFTVLLDGENVTSQVDDWSAVVTTSAGSPATLSEIGTIKETYTISYKIKFDGIDISNSSVTRTVKVS